MHANKNFLQNCGICQDVHPSAECPLDHPDTQTQLSPQGKKWSGLPLELEDVKEPAYIQSAVVNQPGESSGTNGVGFLSKKL